MTQVTSNSVLFSYKKYANLVAPKIEEKVSTKCFYCEVRCPFYWLLPDPMSRPPGLWKSIFLQAPATEPHGRGARWTGGFPLQVNWTKEYFLTWLSCVLMIEKKTVPSIMLSMISLSLTTQETTTATHPEHLQVLWSAFQLLWPIESPCLQVQWVGEF